MLRVEVKYTIVTNNFKSDTRVCTFHVSNDLKKCYLNYYIKGWLFEYLNTCYELCDKFFTFEIIQVVFIKENKLNINA